MIKVMLGMQTNDSASFDSFWNAGKGAGCLAVALACILSPAQTSARTLDHALQTQARAQAWQFNEIIGRLEMEDEVLVYPIEIADNLSVATRRQIANKIAETGAGDGITVLYPDIGEPYLSVFTQMIDGIKNMAKGRVTSIAVGPATNIDEIKGMLRSKDAKVVIALGRQGLKTATALDLDIGVVAGGVLAAGEAEVGNMQVNSLTPDPALLFARFKDMMPRARRIYTVYDPRQNEWLMRLAREGAQSLGMELVAYEAQDLRSAMRAYQEILGKANSSRDAIWLPQDSTTVEESTVLPLVLQESWSRNLAVFSSSFGHVKRGVLFSLYPDNVALGRYLGDSALAMIASGVPATSSNVKPLREVLMAINLRTARHLGLNAGRPGSYDMAFPEQ